MTTPPANTNLKGSGLTANTFYEKKKTDKSFTEKLDPEALEFFNKTTELPFSQQAVAFLNAYWTELSGEAEFIYTYAWDTFKYADMHNKGIQLVYQYEEGSSLDFDIALFFYEQLCKKCEDPKVAPIVKNFKPSLPIMMTAIKRKQELRDEVDVNFDGRVSFLEYLLYQYKGMANPADFCKRSMTAPEEHPEIKKARLALEEVNRRIRAYEEEKARLEKEAAGEGVKALAAKNLLAQIESSPLKEELNKALIKAEAAVRLASKRFTGGAAAANQLAAAKEAMASADSHHAQLTATAGGGSGLKTPTKTTVATGASGGFPKSPATASPAVGSPAVSSPAVGSPAVASPAVGSPKPNSTVATGPIPPSGSSDGAVWWMNRDLRDKQEKYGPKKK